MAYTPKGIYQVFAAETYGVKGDGTTDDTTNLNAALSAATGKILRLSPGKTYSYSGTLTIPANTVFDLNGATLSHTVATTNGIAINSGCTIKDGKIQSPASWNAVNTAWTYAVLYVQGSDVLIDNVNLINIPKVGIGIRDQDNIVINKCRLYGNVPVGTFTGTQTGHFGITFDPGTSETQGDITVSNNLIKSCVQGIDTGNFGAGGPGRGVLITSNVFQDCFNHGIYIGGGEGYNVTGNIFTRCQLPVVTTGAYHVVTGNTLTTAFTGTGDQRECVGISIRDGHNCIVMGNAIKGDTFGTGTSIIDCRELLGTDVSGNIIANNTLDINGSLAVAIRVGGAGPTTNTNNRVQGNTIRSAGSVNLGVITFFGTTTANSYGNQVLDNNITVQGPSAGIYAGSMDGITVRNNNIRLEYDSPGAITLSGILLASCVNARVEQNNFVATSAWGANISYRAIYEITTSSNLRLRKNDYRIDPTKFTSVTNLFLVGASTAIIEENASDVQVFTSSGTWTKPAGVTTVRVVAIGPGGGGGSGRRGAAGTIRCGGGGAGGGSLSERTMSASLLPATVTVTIGTAGVGGAAVTADDTNGNPGTSGTPTVFGTYVRAGAGILGGGGTNATGAAGTAGLGLILGGPGAAASTTGLVGGSASSISQPAAAGGAAGGGIQSTDIANAGGIGVGSFSVNAASSAGGVVDSTLPIAALAGTANLPLPGGSGGGGAASITTAAQAGAAGGIYGGGGSGGGASLNGNASGAGGNGGPGIVVVIST